ncbi:MAG TPA: hypothetical protein VIY48_02510 [Candidatus Paceibacterota bacterium]
MPANRLPVHAPDEAPDLGANVPPHPIPGDWHDDDAAVFDSYFEENPEGVTPSELPIVEGEKLTELPRAPRRLFVRRYVLVLEQGPVMILPADTRRVYTQILNETAATVHCYISDNRADLSALPGTGVVLPNAALIHSPNQYTELPHYDGALWAVVDPASVAASTCILHVMAITE